MTGIKPDFIWEVRMRSPYTAYRAASDFQCQETELKYRPPSMVTTKVKSLRMPLIEMIPVRTTIQYYLGRQFIDSV